ncbi:MULTISPECIES: hypothetical protein [unclassified Micromonospora]|uniref:hypothetical protein n=1 Tax=unclassified Micromonospora TaxID=2617518 RepID=UPI003A85D51B
MSGLLGISIVNYRSAADTAGLIRSIVAGRAAGPQATGPRVAIAIVDNSDQAAELSEIAGSAERAGVAVRVIAGHGNVGYAAGNNLAATWLLAEGADVIWVLNPDTRIVGGVLASALDVLRAGDRAIGATASAAPGGGPDLGMVDLWTGQSGRPPASGVAGSSKLVYAAGHSLLVTRRAWQDLGGFSEDFFLFYEEADMALRAARLVIPTTAVPDLAVEHTGGVATGATADMTVKSTTAYFHASRSCMVFFRKHYRHRVPFAAAARLGYAAKALLARRPDAATAVIRGTVAGLRA